tara:strand:+ start:3250 stop:3786 length:537 start_codon:yes stop_codon:yes gene_type:complete
MKKYEEDSRFRAKAGQADFELRTSFQAGGQEGKYPWQLLNQLASRDADGASPADWSAPEIPPVPHAVLGGFAEPGELIPDRAVRTESMESQRQERFGAPAFFSRGFNTARADGAKQPGRPFTGREPASPAMDRWTAPPAANAERAEHTPAGTGAPQASLKSLLKDIAGNKGDDSSGER